MTKEIITDVQLDAICGANQIPQKTATPADKITTLPKTTTSKDLKVPPLVTVPIPYIRIDEVKPVLDGVPKRPKGYTPKIPEYLILRR